MPKKKKILLKNLKGKKRREYRRKLFAKQEYLKLVKKFNPLFTVRVYNKSGIPIRLDLLRSFFIGTNNILKIKIGKNYRKFNSKFFVIDIPIFLRRMKNEISFRHAVLQLYEAFTFYDISLFKKSQIMILVKETKRIILKKSQRKK